jgi:transcriptional regulator of acetoin/glycerol metabolism
MPATPSIEPAPPMQPTQAMQSVPSGASIAATHADAPLYPMRSEPVREASVPAPHTLEQAEIEMIRAAVEAAGGNISAASKRLGVSRNTIYRKLRWNVGDRPG